MSRSRAARVADARRVVDAGRALVARSAEWLDALVESTGLSREGVALGFARHVETHASEPDLAALVDRAGAADQVHVILSSNVFVAPLRAIAVARAASERVVVRPSRREPVFARALVALLDDPGVTRVEDVNVASVVAGEIHVYGRDETIAAIASRARLDVKVVGHGAGMGIAIVGPSSNFDHAARDLARDVVAFDQRGCLSPRVVFVEGDAPRAEQLGEHLHEALRDLGRAVPRGRLDGDERTAATRYLDTMAFAGKLFRGEDHAVGVGPLLVPPAGRHVHVVPVTDLASLAAQLAPLARFVVAAGVTDTARHVAVVPAHARVSALGEMQRPPLDGPVDRRAAV